MKIQKTICLSCEELVDAVVEYLKRRNISVEGVAKLNLKNGTADALYTSAVFNWVEDCGRLPND